MATKGTKQRTRAHPVVYKGQALQMQDSVRAPVWSLPTNKRLLLTLCVSICLLVLILAGDGMPVKYPVCHERQAWQVTSKIVVEQGLIWEVDE